MAEAERLLPLTEAVRDPGIEVCRIRHFLRTGQLSKAETVASRLCQTPAARLAWPYRSLIWRLQNDPRVIRVERNARLLVFEDIGEPADLVTIDASFISLTLLLPRVPAVLKNGGLCLALVKPQFEVGREKVGKGGIVRNADDQREAVQRIVRNGESLGFECAGTSESPITGREGNREFFILFRKSSEG